MATKPIPDGYHSLTPYFTVKGAAEAIEFYKKAFGAVEIMRFAGPNDTVAHAEIRIGDSVVMLGDEHPEAPCKSPLALGGSPVGLMLYVPDVDAVFARALSFGATATRPVQDQFYGDRNGSLVDPFGHVWTVSTHTEDVSNEEMQRRLSALQSGS